MFIKYSRAFVIYPGGYGTLDELFELLTLTQTDKIKEKCPIILMNSSYWGGMIDWIKDKMIGHEYISPVDPDLMVLMDTPEEAAEFLKVYFKKIKKLDGKKEKNM